MSNSLPLRVDTSMRRRTTPCSFALILVELMLVCPLDSRPCVALTQGRALRYDFWSDGGLGHVCNVVQAASTLASFVFKRRTTAGVRISFPVLLFFQLLNARWFTEIILSGLASLSLGKVIPQLPLQSSCIALWSGCKAWRLPALYSSFAPPPFPALLFMANKYCVLLP